MKRRILLCWNYERERWVNQFDEIFKGEEYFFLNYFSRKQERENFSKVKVYYWEDFKNVQEVLKIINPDIVVFMGLEGPYNLLLNYACKKRGTKTFFLQHGIFHSYRAYLYEEKQKKHLKPGQESFYVNEDNAPLKAKVSFLHNSFRVSMLPVFTRISAFLLHKKLFNSTTRALQFIAGENSQADRYIVYTRYLSKIFADRDKVPDHKFIEIGNDESNSIINAIESNSQPETDGYFLFIDEAFTGSRKYSVPPVLSLRQFNNFLETLAGFAASHGKKLAVKLHPYSYFEDHFISHDNVEFYRDTDVIRLIAGCSGVFGFTSTLLIPALYLKPACIFKMNDYSDIHKALRQMNYCKILDFHTFKPEDIEFIARDSAAKSDFIRHFLYKVDDDCLIRLKAALH